MMRNTYTGQWSDTAEGAILTATQDTNIVDWIRLDYAEDCVFVSPDGEDTRVSVEVIHSETRDQYKAKLTRTGA